MCLLQNKRYRGYICKHNPPNLFTIHPSLQFEDLKYNSKKKTSKGKIEKKKYNN